MPTRMVFRHPPIRSQKVVNAKHSM